MSKIVEIRVQIMYEELRRRLDEYKARNRLTWQQIAEESGMTFSYLTKFSCGECGNPTAAKMQEIMDYLNKVESRAA